MTNLYEIRASYDKDSIVIYQAYSDVIADRALEAQKFEKPFSFKRMTWIKPSFCWLMHRSHWAQKPNQNRILAVHITREGWEKALSLGELTSPEKEVYSSAREWDTKFRKAKVHIQWDTERSPRGTALNYLSIQVGLSRHIIQAFNDEWITKIEDLTLLTRKIHRLKLEGNKHFSRYIPTERIYPTPPNIGKRLLID